MRALCFTSAVGRLFVGGNMNRVLRRKPWIASASGLLLVVAMCATGSAAHADSGSGTSIGSELEGVDGPAVLTGSLRTASGGASDGTPVTLYAWPTSEHLASLADGESVKLAPVGFAETDASGEFEVAISDHDTLDRYRNASGVADLELIAVDGSETYIHNFSTDAVEASSASARLASVQESASHVALKPVKSVKPRFVDADLPLDLQPIEKACASKKVSSMGTFNTTVGLGYVLNGAAFQRFTFKKGSEAHLGVGVSTSGSLGSFSASGSATVTTSAAQGFPTSYGPRAFRTKFEYAKFKTVCMTSSGTVTATRYASRPVSFAGGDVSAPIGGAPSATYCVPMKAGNHFTVDESTAYSVSGGVSSAPTLGANLSARAGFTDTTSMYTEFRKTGKLCGTSGYPGGTPKRLVAK